MIIPSIDLQNGFAVQLIGGKEKVIDREDPFAWAGKFGLASEIAVIDLDAALKTGSNKEVIFELMKKAPCRVGGGIRSIEQARELLDAGARKIIIGTKATPEFLSQLPKERVVAALDARHGEVVVEGWNVGTKQKVEDRIGELKGYVGGFLVTLVETEGSLQGIDIKRCVALKKLCPDVELTVAGGVSSIEEIALLDKEGIDVQVGMALYSGKIQYAEAFLAPLMKRCPAPWPTVVCDERGIALGLVWSTMESVTKAFEERKGIYFSRSRGMIWRKGEKSGATQELLRVELDCDRDCLRFTVRQKNPGFCHTESYSCWGEAGGLTRLSRTLEEKVKYPDKDSYSSRLFLDADLLNSKVVEEAHELVAAKNKDEVASEAADLLYFTLAYLAKNEVQLSEVEEVLNRRSLKISRRGGDKKEIIGGVYVGRN